MRRALKNKLKGGMYHLFAAGQKAGWDILPRHFYSEIPDLAKLRRTTAWRQPYSMTQVTGADLASQGHFVRSLVTPELTRRFSDSPHSVHQAACEANGEPGYGPIEAECLFAFIHTRRPACIVQIGCGVSTAICLHAAQEAGYQPHIRCIEPYPTGFLSELATQGKIELLAKPVEELSSDAVLAGLGAGDFFFVDSSHTLGPAGEVSRIILEHLPRLPQGAYAHFHDIYFPYDYPGDLLDGALFFHHESALLHAFLVGNRRFRLEAALSWLHHIQPQTLRDVFPKYQPRLNEYGLTKSPGHFPSAAYLACVRD